MDISKWIIAFVAVYGGVGGVLFDAILPRTAAQHLRNPAWPPHAKYHNGQSMMLGLFNMLIAIAILFGLSPLTMQNILIAAAVAEVYFLSMLLAPVFPGTAWSDPEFADDNPQPFGLPIQKLLSILATCLVVAGVVVAVLQR